MDFDAKQDGKDTSRADAEQAPNPITLSKTNSSITRRKAGDFTSKYSGSRKSSIDTTNTTIKNVQRVENSFKLAPDDNKRFFAYKLYPNVLELVTEKVKQVEKTYPLGYNSKASASLTRELADSIRREAKNLSVPRYKIVVHVVVGENAGQDVRVGSRCLWNTDFDNCVSVSYTGKYLWTSSVIYVLYSD